MKQTSRDAIQAALITLLEALQQVPIPLEGQWVHQRNPAGNWQGAFVQQPGRYSLLSPHEKLIERLSDELSPVLNADYPDHMKMVGLPGAVSGIIQPRMVIGGLAHECLKRYGTFAISAQQLNELLEETAGFFDRPNIRIRLSAPVLNVHGARDLPPIALPGGIVMRPITDDEATLFYGGNPIFRGSSRMLMFPDFIFVREIEVQKLIGDRRLQGEPFYKPTQDMLDRCILAMSSFKGGGAVGYDGISVTAAELAFGAAMGGQHFWGSEHVPTDRYEITAEDAPKLEVYAKLFENIHPTLEMACQRLVDASRRTKPRDSIVDAIIGLESILLVETGDERQRGEMRFRFSLNYASLFPQPERENAFYTARGLYDQRSQIAHGGEPNGTVKIAGKEMNLHAAAALARTVLRETLARFMPNAAKPDFLADRYWVTKALGLGGDAAGD